MATLGLSGRSQSEGQIKPGPKLPWLPHSMSQSEAMDQKQDPSHNDMEEPQGSVEYLTLYGQQRHSLAVPVKRSSPSTASPTTLNPSDLVAMNDKPTAARRGSLHARPFLPPPPSFDPPPPPSTNPPPPPQDNKPSSSDRPASMSFSECLYSEISEERVQYLEVLPDNFTVQAAPQFQAGQRYQNGGFSVETEQECENLMQWKKTVGCWEKISSSLNGLGLEDETREFNQRGLYVKNGLRLFNCLLTKLNDTFCNHITELSDLADKLDKSQNKLRTLGIAGGTTGAVGGAVAIMGIAFASMTSGISLVFTAVGAGLVVSGSGMGAKAVIDKRKNNSLDRKKVEEMLQVYKSEIADVEWSLCFIWSGMDELRQFNIYRLRDADPEALRMAKMAETLHRSGSYKSQQLGMKSELILQVFARDLDLHYTSKDGQSLKKGSESSFAARIRGLTQELQGELNDLHNMWQTFSLVVCRC